MMQGMSDTPMHYPDGQEVQYRDYVRNTQNGRHARVTGWDSVFQPGMVDIQYRNSTNPRSKRLRWSRQMFTVVPTSRLELVSRKGPESE